MVWTNYNLKEYVFLHVDVEKIKDAIRKSLKEKGIQYEATLYSSDGFTRTEFSIKGDLVEIIMAFWDNGDKVNLWIKYPGRLTDKDIDLIESIREMVDNALHIEFQSNVRKDDDKYIHSILRRYFDNISGTGVSITAGEMSRKYVVSSPSKILKFLEWAKTYKYDYLVKGVTLIYDDRSGYEKPSILYLKDDDEDVDAVGYFYDSPNKNGYYSRLEVKIGNRVIAF